VTSVAFSPDGKQILSGAADGTLRLWDVETGKERRQFHRPGSTVVCVAFSADGRRALTGASGRKGLPVPLESQPVVDRRPFRLWDVETGGDVGLLEGPAGAVWAVAFSRDGLQALSGGEDRAVRLWKMPP
jgi:WD40 repeat protein